MKPLTLEQLKQMGGQPVWVKRGQGDAICRVLGRYIDSHNKDACRFWFTDNEVLYNNSYGNDWVAYQSNPYHEWNKVEDDLPEDGQKVYIC